jgi:hypothetical protein
MAEVLMRKPRAAGGKPWVASRGSPAVGRQPRADEPFRSDQKFGSKLKKIGFDRPTIFPLSIVDCGTCG